MNKTPHYVAISETKRSLKKTLNRPQFIGAAPHAMAERPAHLPAQKISEYVRDWNRDGKLARRSPHTLAARTRIVERLETFLLDSKATCVTPDDIAAFFELLRSGAADLDAADTTEHELKPSTVQAASAQGGQTIREAKRGASVPFHLAKSGFAYASLFRQLPLSHACRFPGMYG